MADKYREIRRTPPLLVHFGNVSTLAAAASEGGGQTSPFSQADSSNKLLQASNRKLNRLKGANPRIDYIKTNMTQWGNNSVVGSYYSSSTSTEAAAVQKKQQLKVFWGKFVPGDVVDVKLSTAAKAGFNFVQYLRGF